MCIFEVTYVQKLLDSFFEKYYHLILLREYNCKRDRFYSCLTIQLRVEDFKEAKLCTVLARLLIPIMRIVDDRFTIYLSTLVIHHISGPNISCTLLALCPNTRPAVVRISCNSNLTLNPTRTAIYYSRHFN